MTDSLGPPPDVGPPLAPEPEPPLRPDPDPTVPAPTFPAPIVPPPLIQPRPYAGLPLDPAPPTRRLIAASFDLLARSSEEMRRASFYIGAIVLGTGAAYAVAFWAFEVATVHDTVAEANEALVGPFAGWLGLLGVIGAMGLIVASLESRAMATAILGAHVTRRPLSVRAALARSRSVFWRVIVTSIIVAIPVGIVQFCVAAALAIVVPQATELATAMTILIAAMAGSPLAYLLSGVVLGDVNPFEATKRSFRIFRARKAAAFVVALFESIAQLLILFGVSAGLDIALRVFQALGLGAQSGAAGILLTTLMILAGIFAVGTLLFTVTAISIAPQVLMFVGLTHATIGLEHVRPGGDRDPDARRAGQLPFRRFTRPMLLGFVFAVVGLLGSLTALPS